MYDTVVIGGGPAGLAAAISANKEGAKVLLIEREPKLGGILKQCIHDGFGLITFKEKLSGPEYSERFIDKLFETDVEVKLLTFVTKIEKTENGFTIYFVNRDGASHVSTKTIVLATGCRERTARQIFIQGTRPSGVFTADTLRILHEEHPDDELWLLMGTDMFLTFQYWYKPDEIMRYAGLCAFGRTEKDGEELFAPQRKYLGQRFPGSRIVTMTLPNLVDVSSTELRARIPKRETDGLLAPAVLGYIYRKHLYGTNLDLKRLTLEDLRPIALSYLKAKRIPHVLGTEQTAKALAEKYGADVEKARFAALLHDSTKRLSMEEQLAMCEHYHIELDELEKKALKLLHAKTGAALARDVFGADDEIYNAILWHTTGKANMTLLEKVIYLADYIEPNRDFDGVEDLRKVVWEDLDKGLEMGLAMTVEEMEQMGNPVHHNTLQALEYLRGHTHE